MSNLHFSYLGLNERLYQFHERGVKDIDCSLLISLEKEYYEGENMKLIMKDLRELMKGKKILMDYNGIKQEFKINQLNLQLGDTLNRHMFYYRFCTKYFDEHKIYKEELIPLEIREKFNQDSYIAGTKEGKDWFRDNLEAIQLFSDQKKLTKDFEISDGITTIFEETENTPKLVITSYGYWYKHPRYNEIEKALEDLCNMKEQFINNCYKFEAERFLLRLEKRNEAPKYKDLFLKQSYKYLFDETIPSVIENGKNIPNNHIDLYSSGLTPAHLTIYEGKKAKNSILTQDYLKNLLNGLNDSDWITIKS